MRVQGTEGVKLIECVNPERNKWRVRWDVRSNTDPKQGGVNYEEAEFLRKPSLNEVKDIVIAWYNNQIDDRIRSGFIWNTLPVWLSTENQFNYKAAYDIAVQTNGTTLPVVFKFGNEDSPVYHTFSTLADITDFYTKSMIYVQKVLADGWKEKDTLDYTPYVQALNARKDSSIV